MRSAFLAVFFHLDAIQAQTLAGFSSSLCLARLTPMPWPKLTYPTLNQFQNQSLGQRRDVFHVVDRLKVVIQVQACVFMDRIGNISLAASVKNLSAVHSPSRATKAPGCSECNWNTRRPAAAPPVKHD